MKSKNSGHSEGWSPYVKEYIYDWSLYLHHFNIILNILIIHTFFLQAFNFLYWKKYFNTINTLKIIFWVIKYVQNELFDFLLLFFSVTENISVYVDLI